MSSSTMLFLLAALCMGLGGALLFVAYRKQSAQQDSSAGGDDAALQPPNVADPVGSPSHLDVPEPEVRHNKAPRATSRRMRRERREWARQHGFAFAKSDDFLADEWAHGPASGEVGVKDVVSGSINGRELHVATMGGVPVVAMRRGTASSHVVEIRRHDPDPEYGVYQTHDQGEEGASPRALDALLSSNTADTPLVRRIAGYDVMAVDPAPVDRCLDTRCTAALSTLPPSTRLVWAESNWVLAAFDDDASASDWDAVVKPLALLADAFHVLPPAEDSPRPQTYAELGDEDPSRPLGERVELPGNDGSHGAGPHAANTSPKPHAVPDPAARPPIKRPEEPVALPTRLQYVSHGTVERPTDAVLGTDEVDAIADGRPASRSTVEAKVVRRQPASSSIFDDISSELGTEAFSDSFKRKLGDAPGDNARDREMLGENAPNADSSNDGPTHAPQDAR